MTPPAMPFPQKSISKTKSSATTCGTGFFFRSSGAWAGYLEKSFTDDARDGDKTGGNEVA